jgi:1-acyl-sn-glycerol-3-phosphate acyltransferase
MTNHTTNADGPAIYVFIQPRAATAIAKRALWHNPVTRFFMRLWKIIPIDRGRVDTHAIRRCLRALDDGLFVGVAPEGTRIRTGALGPGHPGVAMIAAARRVPIYPVAHTGFDRIIPGLRRLRRATVTIRVGRPFVVRDLGTRPRPAQLREITTEIMYQLATLLPPERRGKYIDLDRATTQYLEFV